MPLDATPVLRRYARLRRRWLASKSPARIQERELLRLLRQAAETRFGKDHGFAGIKSVAEFQARVPLRSYEAFWDEYFKLRFPLLDDVAWPGRVPYFAVSSGTSSGRTKHIPVTRAMVRSNNKAGTELLVHHVLNNPDSRVLGGKNFMLGGSVAMEEREGGVKLGDLSGIARAEVPLWSQPYLFPSVDDALESDWEKKIDKLAAMSLHEDIRTIAGTPSWLLLFFERVQAIRGGGKIRDVYPNLALMVYGGMSFAPYRGVFEDWLEGSDADWREVYSASEGFVASADRGVGEGMLVNLDTGLFFEFVPVDELDADRPTRLWIDNVEAGCDYALVLSTCAGLWGYRIGDVVRVVDTSPPRLVVTGRTSYFLSAFGEHLAGDEIEQGVLAAAAEVGRRLAEFSVGPLYPEGDRRAGQHRFVVELGGEPLAPAERERFGATLDATLCDLNEDYEVHRRHGYQLLEPTCRFVREGTFKDWMKRRGKLGGQNKVPRVILDPEIFGDLSEFTSARTTG